ncbi:anti-phage-associated DUF1156 domain-containing protein [Aminobacter sp. MET-1]|uniref:anti-phage-associated DUF1156 domain-containing protein n=1 Tax=Aminobacter sp. MET-1 TaxID=2951085 RepID=UPI00226A6E64|nr:anti-phage-associated DUF1156 domain-containing protein [Aminobacter sp. MET-1]MCX8571143.1 DUF1156 domain-containing protein [Aminobacter sp. MET-1]MCX8573188.1 DUF1156 domain-containing protein [Aminobacter sp. MET-1]
MTVTTLDRREIKVRTLADAPALIERLWPAQKLSAEAKKERKAGSGQTLTALGSYWKGRKPLVLVRACILGSLLPATDNPEADLRIFERLMAMDDLAFGIRDNRTSVPQLATLALKQGVLKDQFVCKDGSAILAEQSAAASELLQDHQFSERLRTAIWNPKITAKERIHIKAMLLSAVPYEERVSRSLRPEELGREDYADIWREVNEHLGTSANSHAELVEQLGIMRFGRKPKIADTFSGGGSIPFEAARMGCDVHASDLNPIACMLTWGALNIIGASAAGHAEMKATQAALSSRVDREITMLAIEHDEVGNRAKAFLYCLETRCPSSGWMVPLLPSRIISKTRSVVVQLVPDRENRRYEIEVVDGVSTAQLKAAETGTLVDGYLVHSVDGELHRTSIKSIRGDHRAPDGSSKNQLRQWEKADFIPRGDDIFQERLYCIQWIIAKTVGKQRYETFFSSVNDSDLRREKKVQSIVRENLAKWQEAGWAPDMPILDGRETEGPIRTMGWTYWHHFFNPRQLHMLSCFRRFADPDAPHEALLLAKLADRMARNTRWDASGEKSQTVFDTQGLKTFFNYSCRAFPYLRDLAEDLPNRHALTGHATIETHPADDVREVADIFITDPPYADAVHYHEITEFFISWLRRNPPSPFDQWTWDSRRPLAIKGEGEDFRREMVAAYGAMANHMPDNGLQVVMFTHQSGSVWADLAQIFWGAGLQVQAAWYIATETTSELRKGGYVQGTVILVLRKRRGSVSGYEDEIVQDVRAEVAHQIDTLVGLNQSLKGNGRVENLFEDADLQMAGYAAALRVLTGYTKIDGRDMTVEAVRQRRKGEVGVVDRMIEYAVSVANEHMVPDGISARLWQQLKGPERFYLKMVGLEAGGHSKLDNYQNFQRAFRVSDYNPFMGNVRPNSARLKRATEFGPRAGFDIPDFGDGAIRAVLFGVDALVREVEPEIVLAQLQDIMPDYFRRRQDMIEVAEYFVTKRGRDDDEGRHAGVLANLLRNERL